MYGGDGPPPQPKTFTMSLEKHILTVFSPMAFASDYGVRGMQNMVRVAPLTIDGSAFVSIEVELPQTHLSIVECDEGYVMCGALDIGLLREKLASRKVVAARAVGVNSLQALLDGRVDSCTQAAESLGIEPGMSIREALLRMKRSGCESVL